MKEKKKSRSSASSAQQNSTDARSSGFASTVRAVLIGDAELSPMVRVLIVSAATVLCLLPFLNKSYHLDDPLFIWAAQHIQSDPGNPYNFEINWYQSSKMMSVVTKNPPGGCYYIAAAASVLGYSEVALHFAFLFPAVGVVLGTYLLGRFFVKSSTLAALLCLFSPVFLVSSTTVMCDVLMLCLMVFAVYFWMKGVESHSHLFYLLASILIPLCALTKYFGMALIPLLLVYSLYKERRIGLWLVHFIIPIAVLYWYQTVTHGLYGHGLLTDAASYASEAPETLSKWSLAKVLVGLSFSGGCVACVLFFSRRMYGWLEIGIGAAVALLIAFVVGSATSLGEFKFLGSAGTNSAIGFQFGILVLGGISLLYLTVMDFVKNRNAESLLLALWVVGTFVFATFVNWTMNGRSILPMAPAVALVLVRRLELRSSNLHSLSLPQVLVPLVASAILAFGVTIGDYKLADSARTAAAQIHEKYGSRAMWFQGHWGFQYYIEGWGAHAIDAREFSPKVGDVIIIPTTNSNIYNLPKEWSRLLEEINIPANSVFSTMNRNGAAGFYADVYGILPFTLSKLIPEKYYVMEVY